MTGRRRLLDRGWSYSLYAARSRKIGPKTKPAANHVAG
jgi:hypothetical protein